MHDGHIRPKQQATVHYHRSGPLLSSNHIDLLVLVCGGAGAGAGCVTCDHGPRLHDDMIGDGPRITAGRSLCPC